MNTLTDKEYFAYPAISKSQLHAWTRDNPMAFWRGCLLNPKHTPVEENDAIANGKLRHTLLLEPHKVESEFLVIEDGKGLSSRNTQAFKKHIADNPSVTVVKQSEYDLAKLQIETLKSYTPVQDLLAGASVEQAFFWTDKATHLPLKAKLDLIKRIKEGVLIVEYKTTGKSFDQIERGLDVMGWHWDAGMQCKAGQAKYWRKSTSGTANGALATLPRGKRNLPIIPFKGIKIRLFRLPLIKKWPKWGINYGK